RLRTRWVPLRRQPTVPLRFRLRHTPLLLLAVVAGAFFLAPLAAVVWDALTRGAEHGLTLRWFAMLFNPGHHAITGDSPLQAILNSLRLDRKSTRLNSSHVKISYAVFCLKKKKKA